jgi:hypothetical protein
MTNPVVGRGKTETNVAGNPDNTPTKIDTLTADQVYANISAKFKSRIGTQWNMGADAINRINSISTVDDYTKSQLTQIGVILKKLNYPVKNTEASVKTLLLNDADLIPLVGQSRTAVDLINSLNKSYLPGLDTQVATPNLPSRSVYKYQQKDLETIANNAYQAALGRDATKEELTMQLAKIKPMVDAGTLTTTKKVVNPNTKKMENVSTQTPGFSQASAQASIEEQLKAANPEAYQRNKALAFSKDLNSVLGGGL